jgi:hypothetical protein
MAMRDATLTLALLTALLAAAPIPALAEGPGGRGRDSFHRPHFGRAPYFGGTAGRGFDPAWPGERSDRGLAGRPSPLDWLHGRPDPLGHAPAPRILLVPLVIDRDAAERAERRREESIERQIDSALGDPGPSEETGNGDVSAAEGDGADRAASP